MTKKLLYTYCECGGRYIYKNYIRHILTKRHQFYELCEFIE